MHPCLRIANTMLERLTVVIEGRMKSSDERPSGESVQPMVSVVMLVDTSRENAQVVLDALDGQTCDPGVMEIVVLDMGGAGAEALRMPERYRVKLLRRPGKQYWRVARAAAAREAEGEIVAFLEDHCSPEPEWAEELVAAYGDGRWAAVGYVFTNGSRDSWWTRACLATDYGVFMHPREGGPAPFLSGNNVSYARWFLEELGEAFEKEVVVDYNIQQRLLASGHGMKVASGVVAAHRCYGSLVPLCAANYEYVRILGAARAGVAGWGMGMRLVRALAVLVLVPPLRVWRLGREMVKRPGGWGRFWSAVPVVYPVYVAAAAGEASGYAGGVGDAEERFAHWELNTARIS